MPDPSYRIAMPGFKVLLLCFALIALSISPMKANGQFWKKIFNKEEPKKKKQAPKPAPVEAQVVQERKEPVYPDSYLKPRYRIDILLPLSLDKYDAAGPKSSPKRTPEAMLPYIQFYEGVAMASEVLRGQDHHLDIYVHDMSEANGDLEAYLLNKGAKNSDLIIGAAQSPEIPSIARFANKHKTNFLSVLSPSDAGIIGNPYFILVQPTLSTHIEALLAFAQKKFRNKQKHIIYNSSVSGEKDAYEKLKRALKKEKDVKIVESMIFDADQRTLCEHFSPTDINVLFIGVLDLAEAEKILNTLAAMPKNYRFEIFGMPSWKSLKGFTQSSPYMGLSVYYTSPFFYDPTTGTGQYLNIQCKEKYGSAPSEMTYRGYETLYWMATLLKKYGHVFNTNLKDISAAPFTCYEILPVWNEDNDFLYLENQKLYLFHFQNGGYILEQP